MTRNDDFTGRLEGYLDDYEGRTLLPDAVRDAIRTELPHTKQTGPVRGLSRILTMTLQVPAPARYGLAAAAVVAAVLIGANMLNRDTPVGPSVPTPTPTPATEPTSLVDAPTPNNLPAGDYFIDLPAYPARIEFELPTGWWHIWDRTDPADGTLQALLVLDALGGNESAWGLAFTLVDEVPIDPCDVSAGLMDRSVTDSAESLAAAFSAWPAFPATVEDVSLAGFSGKKVEITAGDSSRCAGREPLLFRTPTAYDFGPSVPTSGPSVTQFTLLDVNGSVLALWTTEFSSTTEYEVSQGVSPDPEGHAEDLVELHQILDSIVLTPR